MFGQFKNKVWMKVICLFLAQAFIFSYTPVSFAAFDSYQKSDADTATLAPSLNIPNVQAVFNLIKDSMLTTVNPALAAAVYNRMKLEQGPFTAEEMCYAIDISVPVARKVLEWLVSQDSGQFNGIKKTVTNAGDIFYQYKTANNPAPKDEASFYSLDDLKNIVDPVNKNIDTAFMAVDWNVARGKEDYRKISEPQRIVESMPTFEYLIKETNIRYMFVMTHAGRPKAGVYEDKFSLWPVVDDVRTRLVQEKGLNVVVVGLPFALDEGTFNPEEVAEKIRATKEQNPDKKIIFVFENIRFYPGEQASDKNVRKEFIEKLLSLAERPSKNSKKPFGGIAYINEAYSKAHRGDQSSMEMVNYIPKENRAAGRNLEEEIKKFLKFEGKARGKIVAYFGGAKDDKWENIGKIAEKKKDQIKIVAMGAIAHAFIKFFEGRNVGKSKIPKNPEATDDPKEKKKRTKTLEKVISGFEKIQNSGVTVLSPLDFVPEGRTESVDDLGKDLNALDLGKKTIQDNIDNEIDKLTANDAIILNGGAGMFDHESGLYMEATKQLIVKSIEAARRGVTVFAVGGDMINALFQFVGPKLVKEKVIKDLDEISELILWTTGGGVVLEALEKGITNVDTISVLMETQQEKQKKQIKKEMSLSPEESEFFEAYAEMIDVLNNAFPGSVLMHTASTKAVDTRVDGDDKTRKPVLNLTRVGKAIVFEVPQGMIKDQPQLNYEYAMSPMFISQDSIPEALQEMIEAEKPTTEKALSKVLVNYLNRHFKDYPIHVTQDDKTRSQKLDPEHIGTVSFNVKTTIATFTEAGDLIVRPHFWIKHNDKALEAVNEYIDMNLKTPPPFEIAPDWYKNVDVSSSQAAIASLSTFGRIFFKELTEGNTERADILAQLVDAIEISDLLDIEGIFYDEKTGWFASEKDREAETPYYGDNLELFQAQLNSIEQLSQDLMFMVTPTFKEKGIPIDNIDLQNAVIAFYHRLLNHLDETAKTEFKNSRVFEALRDMVGGYATALNEAIRDDKNVLEVNNAKNTETIISHLSKNGVNLTTLEQGFLRSMVLSFQDERGGWADDILSLAQVLNKENFVKAFRYLKVDVKEQILPSQKPNLAIDGGQGQISSLAFTLRLSSDSNAQEEGHKGTYAIRTRELKGKTHTQKLNSAQKMLESMLRHPAIATSRRALITNDGKKVLVSDLVKEGKLIVKADKKRGVVNAQQDFVNTNQVECAYPVKIKLNGDEIGTVYFVDCNAFEKEMGQILKKKGIKQDNIPRPIIIDGIYFGLTIDATPGGVEIGNKPINEAYDKGTISLNGPPVWRFAAVDALQNTSLAIDNAQEQARLEEILEQVKKRRLGDREEPFIYLKAQITKALLPPLGGGVHFSGRLIHKIPMLKEVGAMYFTNTSCSTTGATGKGRAISVRIGFGRKIHSFLGTTLHMYTGGDKTKGPYGHTGAQGTGAAAGFQQHLKARAMFTSLRTATGLAQSRTNEKEAEILIEGGSIFDMVDYFVDDISEEMLKTYLARYSAQFPGDIAFLKEMDKDEDDRYAFENSLSGKTTSSILYEDFITRYWPHVFRFADGYDNEMGYSFKMEEGINALLKTAYRQKRQEKRNQVKIKALKEYEEKLQANVTLERVGIGLKVQDSLAQTIPATAYTTEEVWLVATLARLGVLVEQLGDDIFNKIDEINQHPQAKDLAALQGTPGYDEIVRGIPSDEDVDAYMKSIRRGEWMTLIPAGGDATRLGLAMPKLILNLRELLSPISESSLNAAILKALDKKEITWEQVQKIRELKSEIDKLRDISIIGRILEKKAATLTPDERKKQTITICCTKGDEQATARELKANNYYGFSRESFIIQPQVKNPTFIVKGNEVKIAKDVERAGGNGVPILETALPGKAYIINAQGVLEKLKKSTLQYAKERGVKHVSQNTIGDLRSWVDSPWNEGFVASVYHKLASGELVAVAENVKQNPELIQKGGTAMYNPKTGKGVFIEKLAMGELLDKVDFENQPLATFNHVFNLEAFQEIAETQIPVYLRKGVADAEGNPTIFTELVGGDIILTALQDMGKPVGHVEREISIYELKGTASLTITIEEALRQDDILVKEAAGKLAAKLKDLSNKMSFNVDRDLKSAVLNVEAMLRAIDKEYLPASLKLGIAIGDRFSEYDIKDALNNIHKFLSMLAQNKQPHPDDADIYTDSVNRLFGVIKAMDEISKMESPLRYKEEQGNVVIDFEGMLSPAASATDSLTKYQITEPFEDSVKATELVLQAI
ncbi:MAG: phosphoglycerate kinase [Candidatus Omnitrophica bacterium]|nr:phosphoglycerate kinase [Candidatus Omnitrophota bacterium]MBU1924606.1 phosphoglycerate kinase [Candidatus Omnitrophota bacterium]